MLPVSLKDNSYYLFVMQIPLTDISAFVPNSTLFGHLLLCSALNLSFQVPQEAIGLDRLLWHLTNHSQRLFKYMKIGPRKQAIASARNATSTHSFGTGSVNRP